MSKIRKSRDINTGISYFINIDTNERINDYKYGSGLITASLSTPIKTLTNDKTKDSPSFQMKQNKPNKAIKPKINAENKGEMIVKLLQAHPDNMKFKSNTTRKTKDQLNNDILSIDFDKIIEM